MTPPRFFGVVLTLKFTVAAGPNVACSEEQLVPVAVSPWQEKLMVLL
jgi:hypothetical protein